MEVVLIRHAAPAVAEGICYGRLDLPLAEPVRPSPAAMLRACDGGRAPHMPTRLIASPQVRALATANLLHAALPVADSANGAGSGPESGMADRPTCGLAVEIEPRLRELDFGSWEGLAWDAVPRADLDLWAGNLLHACPHGGETAAQAMDRVAGWADSLMHSGASRADERIWVVGHAGPMRMLASHWLQVPLEQTLAWSLDWGATCAFSLDGGNARLAWWNRVAGG